MLKKWLTNYLPENKQYYINITGDIEILRALLKRYSAPTILLFSTVLTLFLSHSLLYAGWEIQTVDLASTYDYDDISIALDSNNYPHIAYHDYANKGLKYAKWNGSSWNVQTIENYAINGSSVDGRTSIALDSNNYPHISYYSGAAPTPALKYAEWNGTSWSIQIVDSGSFFYLIDTSISLDSNGYPHISYNGLINSNYSLKYAKWTGVSWSTQTVDFSITGTAITLDKNDNPHISYCGAGNPDLKYAKWTGVSWSTQTIDSDPTGLDVGESNSISLDSNGYPHIAYSYVLSYDTSSVVSGAALKYAKWTGSSWSIQTVDSGGITGFDNSISIDTSGNPHISYGSSISIGSTPYIKYAKWNGTSWAIETVAVGDGNSIALDTNNYPHIAYWGGDALKYAKWILPSTLVNEPLGQIKIIGSTAGRGTVNPDKGEKVMIDFKGTEAGKFECKIFTLTGELVYQETKDSMTEGRFEWIPKDIASGIYVVYVKGPGVNIHEKMAILR